MKLKKYKKVCGLMLCAMMLVSVGGCRSSQSGADAASDSVSNAQAEGEGNTFVYEDESETAPVSETIMGMVQSVEGSQITLSVGGGRSGEGPSGDKPDGEDPNGEAPDGEGPSGGEAPNGEAPDGEGPSGGDSPNGEAPDGEGPSGGDSPNGEAPAKDGGMAEGKTAILTIVDASVLSSPESDSVSLDDITEGTMLRITFDESGEITAIEAGGGKGGRDGGGKPGDQASGVESYDAAAEYTEDTEVKNESFTSSGTDENAIHVSAGANVKLDGITLDRASKDSAGGDTSSFYGVGAGLLATDGTVTVKNSTITTDAAGGAGIFAYGSGIVYVSDTKISTVQDTSGGIHAAGGGTLYAWDLDVTTEGESSAAIRSDRGGGTMVVEGGSYTSNGVGSPAVYCTADIAVKDAALTACGSEAVCVEGLNSIHLFDCDISGNMSDDSQNDTTWGIIVYQSMSGDAEVGTSTMQIVGGTLTAQNGGLIYTTNTQSNILLSDVDITYAEDSEFFLQCTGNKNRRGWGEEGSNGAQCIFTADEQEMQGNVIWDSISQLDYYMMNGSTLTGAFVQDEAWAGDGGDGYASLTIDAESKWIVTGDSTLTTLNQEGVITDASGRTVTVKKTDGTVCVEGSSGYTVTVENYTSQADCSNAARSADWEDYEVGER